jgi:hypothetical protein
MTNEAVILALAEQGYMLHLLTMQLKKQNTLAIKMDS